MRVMVVNPVGTGFTWRNKSSPLGSGVPPRSFQNNIMRCTVKNV